MEDELEDLNVNIEGREDEAPLTEYDEMEDDIDISDFELEDLSNAQSLDENLVEELFKSNEELDDDLDEDF